MLRHHHWRLSTALYFTLLPKCFRIRFWKCSTGIYSLLYEGNMYWTIYDCYFFLIHSSFSHAWCRLSLAVMHYTENGKRTQQRTSDGRLAYTMKWKKYNRGGYIIRPVYVKPTYGECCSISILHALSSIWSATNLLYFEHHKFSFKSIILQGRWVRGRR